MLTIPLQCFLNDKNIFHINFTHSLAFQWKLLVTEKHEELFASKILVCVQPLITRLCLLHVHKHWFIVHNRFLTINHWSAVHNDRSLQQTSLQRYIVCFARYCCKEVSLERYLDEISWRSYWYLADLSYPWDVSLIIGNRSREIRTNAFLSIIVCITFAQYCRLRLRTDKLPNVTLSVPYYRTRARVITFLPVFLWRVTFGKHSTSAFIKWSFYPIFTIFYLLGAESRLQTNRAPASALYPGESKQPHKEPNSDTRKGLWNNKFSKNMQ